MAVIIALMSTLLMSALGAALVLTTSTEAMVAVNFQQAQEGLYAAEASLDLAMADLSAAPDWSGVLDGSVESSFAQPIADQFPTLADGSSLDLDRIVNMLNCRRAAICTWSSLVATTMQRPWGWNNPVWRLYIYGPLSSLLAGANVESSQYVVVLVADDPLENDQDPARDGAEGNPGAGRLLVRAEAFGVRGGRQAVEATVTRQPAGRVRVVAWRLLR